MLESDFVEGAGAAEPFLAATAATSDADDGSFDSDDETDKVANTPAATRTKLTLPAGVREIVITSSAYTTYHAVLVWMLYDYIQFATLCKEPVLLPADPAPKAPSPAADPNLPLPASPKSVYALAHLLELPDLAKLALDNIKRQLTSENVLYHLVTDVAVHDEVRQTITAFAKANWAAVKVSKAARELVKPEVLELLPHPVEAGARLFELAREC